MLKEVNENIASFRNCIDCGHAALHWDDFLKAPLKWLFSWGEMWCCYDNPFKVNKSDRLDIGFDRRCPVRKQ